MKKILAALLFCIASTAAMAGGHSGQLYRGHQYYHGYHGGYYRPYYGRDHFVAGVVTGAIIGGVLAPRPVYVAPPVYAQPAYQYVREYDPYCNCWVMVRRVVDPYYQGY